MITAKEMEDDIHAGLAIFLVSHPDLSKMSLNHALTLAYLAGRTDSTRIMKKIFNDIYHDE